MKPNVCRTSRSAWSVSALLMALVLAGCAAPRQPAQRAPVSDRAPVAASAAVATPLPPGAENAGKPGYYTVRPGDTLIRIGLETGQNWRDIQTWNGLVNPNVIEVGQVLRVAPPEPVVASAPAAPAATSGSATQPIASSSAQGRPLTESSAATTSTPSAAPAQTPAPVAASEEVRFVWPANGQVIDPFDEARN